MFSEVNTRIISWGAILLLVVLYLGPIYGWGEYSYFRGKLDLQFSIRNYSAIEASTPGNLSSPNLAVHFYQLFMQLTAAGNVSMEETVKQLPGMDPVYFRRPIPSLDGITYPVRVRDKELLLCLWDHSINDRMSYYMELALEELSVPAMLNVHDLHLQATVEVHQFEVFERVIIPYQESAQCGLDYSRVNDNIYTFIGLSWLCCLLLPFGVIFYCHTRTIWVCRKAMHIFTVEGATHEDMYITRVLAYSSLASFICNVPHYAVNLAAGLGSYIPRDAFFISQLLLFFSWCLPWLFFVFTARIPCLFCCVCSCARENGTCSLPILSCSEDVVQRKRNRLDENDRTRSHELEVKRGLLSSIGSPSNSPALSVNSSIARQRDLETVL